MIFKTYISTKDIKKFANISLDKNPIHLNIKTARRQFYGSKIAHGALLIEKFLVYFFKKKKYLIKTFDCYFKMPCEVGSHVFYKYTCKNSRVKCDIRIKNKQICFFEYTFTQNFLNEKISIKNKKSQKINKFLNKSQIKKFSTKRNKFIKHYDNDKNIFLNILYNLSRVIGMEVPGYYSLFSNFNVKFNPDKNNDENYYKVKNIINKINLVETNYVFKNYNLTSNSFLLNPPIDYDKILKKRYLLKKTKITNDKKILIIGGSRGLGLMSTYYFLGRGYKVYSTYTVYDKYLKNIQNNRLNIFKYDIKNNLNLKKIKTIARNSDLIMFFASPKILNQPIRGFDKDYFNSINIFNKIFIEKILKNLSNKKIFFPSTIFLNSMDQNKFLEYKKSKKIMEKYLINQKNNFKCFFPRLPRFKTDQNNFNIHNEKIENLLTFEKYLKTFEYK